ncbi:MMS19 nucleotide excision repair protein homolog [Styela clava]
MEELVQKYLKDDENEKDSLVKDIILAISTGSGSILQLMETLHHDLTSTDVDVRLKPVNLLAAVLSDLHPSCLKSKESAVIIEFLCQRLQDHFSLQSPTLKCLVALSSRGDLQVGAAESIIKILFKEVHVPSCMQSDRRNVYELLANLLEHSTTEVRNLGDEFVYGVITAVDGEQDPRNLLKVFDLLYSVVRSGFDLSKFAEEFFEVVGCYFPIDFHPPSDLSENKVVITNKELVIGLRRVLTSSLLFAPFCIPLMIEKLESDVQSAKIDAILTLKSCMNVYSSEDIKSHVKSLWICIRKEVLSSNSKEIEEACHDLLKRIVLVLSKAPVEVSKKSELDVFLEDVKVSCLPHLVDHLQEVMAWSSSKLMISCSEASKRSCEIIVSSMVPVLLKSQDKKDMMIAEKRLAMEVLVNAVKSTSLHEFKDDMGSHPLSEHKNDLIELFCGRLSLNEFVHLRTIALAGVAALCNLGLLITPSEQITIVHSLINCLNNEKDTAILNDLHMTCGFLSSKWPDVAIAHLLPVLKISLTGIFSINQQDKTKCLSTICSISTRIEVTSITCDLLMEQVLSRNVDEKNVSTILACLDSLYVIVKGNVKDKSTVDHFANVLVFPLIETCVKLSVVPSLPEQCCSTCSDLQSFSSNCITWPIMQKACEILRTICQQLEPGKIADNICVNLKKIFLDCDLVSLDIKIDKSTFNPFLFTKLPLQTRLISILTATICAFHNKVLFPSPDTFLEKLLHLCGETIDQPSYASASKCIAGIINKQKEPSTAFLDKVLQISDCLFDDSVLVESKVAILSLIVWVTKALVIRSHSYTMRYADILFQLFATEKWGKMAADSFDIILRDSEEVLSTSCHAVVRLMYKQRFFQSVLPKLTTGFHDTEEKQKSMMETEPVTENSNLLSQTKANYLTALSHLLRYLPKQVLNQHLSSLLPMLIKSLNSDEGPLLVSVLSTLYNLTQEAKSSVEPHVDMLLEHFVRLSDFKANMHVRIQALKCIGVMTLLPVSLVLPHKKKTIRLLSCTLDDKKRLVRKEAVKARTEWCLLGDV